MRRVSLALLFAALAAGCAARYAPQQFDFGGLDGLDGAALGVVESVREVELRDPTGIAAALEHTINAETGEELRVRLDNGTVLTVVQDVARRFQPGERVRVTGGRRPQVERV